MIKQKSSGWLVDIQPEGRGGRRYRKTLKTKAEALRYEACVKTQVNQIPEWQPARKEQRRLSDLLELWYEGHGRQLKDHRKIRARMAHAIEAMGNPQVHLFNRAMFSEYRSGRIQEGSIEATVNREHAHLRAMFNELERLGHWKQPNPLQGLRRFKEKERSLSFLSRVDVERGEIQSDASLIIPHK